MKEVCFEDIKVWFKTSLELLAYFCRKKHIGVIGVKSSCYVAMIEKFNFIQPNVPRFSIDGYISLHETGFWNWSTCIIFCGLLFDFRAGFCSKLWNLAAWARRFSGIGGTTLDIVSYAYCFDIGFVCIFGSCLKNGFNNCFLRGFCWWIGLSEVE